MKDMNITDSLKASLFWFGWKFHHDVAFGGLGEDQNISLAIESWEIGNKWKTFSAVRRIAETFWTPLDHFFNSDYRF